MIRRPFILAACVLLLMVVLPVAAQVEGCAAPELNALATVGMIADVVTRIGGSCVQVTEMMGPGVDPHLYSATLQDVELLFDSDILFYGGLNLEARLTDVFGQVRDSLGTPVIAVSEAIDPARLHTEPGSTAADPHVWMDVSLWMQAAAAVRDGLFAALPERRAYLEANAERYLGEMAALDSWIRAEIESIPAGQRVLVTAHDAFQYFGHAYGIEVYAPQGISTATEAGVQDIRRVIDLLVERKIPAIFVETSVSSDVVEAIQAGARSRGHNVLIGGSLFSDAMGESGTLEGTYLGMIRSNVETITRALRGESSGEGS